MEIHSKPTTDFRIKSLDLLRGAIMVLMAIDHVRVYAGIPAGGQTIGLFFTRWITHFCAPGFVFLAGTAAFLYGIKIRNTNALSKFLLIRGLMLVILEITLIRFLWSLNLDFTAFFLAGVIWMLGWCMIVLSLLVRFRPVVVGSLGLFIVLFQQLFSLVPRVLPESIQPGFGKFWEFIYTSGFEGIEGVSILYVLIPWIGVMAAGYGFGLIMQMEKKKRDQLCLRIGLLMIVLFLIIGSVIAWNQGSEEGRPFVFRLLNQNKYPASQLYLFMTLGPLIALIPWADRVRGWFANVLSLFGRVPMFYYLMHIPVIHISALIVNYFTQGNMHLEWYYTAPFTYLEEGFRWSLPLLYLIFAIDVTVLYFLCKWYADIKRQRPNSLLKYI